MIFWNGSESMRVFYRFVIEFVGNPIKRFNPTTFLWLSQAMTWIYNIICRGMFCSMLRWELIVYSVNIHGIDVHQCLILIYFHNWTCFIRRRNCLPFLSTWSYPSPSPVFLVASVFRCYSFLCCPIMCLYVLGSVLWCPLQFPLENDVRFVVTSSCL
jgi:hypothetical protein